jgi:predicted DCC family thiol-disulfide oxidoreductase YuxK
MFQKFKQNILKKVDATGLAVFRICYITIVFFEVLQLYKYRNIIYGKYSIGSFGELHPEFIFRFWFVILLFLFLGIFTRISSIINYIFGVIIFSSATAFEYHVFYAYVGINFLILFMPISRVLSLDSLLQKLKYTTIGKPFIVDRKILKLNYLIPVFVAIGLVYFDSIFHKFSSKMWINGLGVWLPSSLPMVTWNDTSFLLNQKWLILSLGYLVFIFETVFIFLFWNKKFRLPFFIIGVFFHIGILIAYPIPWFALTVISVYLLLVPIAFWNKISEIIKCKRPVYKFYYDAECPLCNKVIVVIKHFDIFNKINCLTVQENYKKDEIISNYNEDDLLINIHGVTNDGKVVVGFWTYVELLKAMRYTYLLGLFISLPLVSLMGEKIYKYIAGNRLTVRCTAENCSIPVYTVPPKENTDFLVKGWNQFNITKWFWKVILTFLVFGQLLMIWFSPLIQNNLSQGLSPLNTIVSKPYTLSKSFYRKYFGVTRHDVFLDYHFEHFNHILRVEALTIDNKIVNLPIINDRGNPIGMNNGSIWRNVSFNMITPVLGKSKIEKAVVPYFLYFQETNKIKVKKYFFYIKTIEIPSIWEKDFLKKQMEKSWEEVGEVIVEKEIFFFEWNKRMDEILSEE